MTKAVSGAAESKVSLVDLETLRRHQHSAVEKKRRQRFQEALFKLKQVSGCFAKVHIHYIRRKWKIPTHLMSSLPVAFVGKD